MNISLLHTIVLYVYKALLPVLRANLVGTPNFYEHLAWAGLTIHVRCEKICAQQRKQFSEYYNLNTRKHKDVINQSQKPHQSQSALLKESFVAFKSCTEYASCCCCRWYCCCWCPCGTREGGGPISGTG